MSIKHKIILTIGIIAIVGAILLGYATFIEAKSFTIKEHKIAVDGLPDEYDGLKIIHFSDLHYGTSVKDKELKKIVKMINNVDADIVVFTGDLVDNKITDEEHKKLAKELQKIDAKLEKYIINGNHDALYNKWNTLVEDAGFVNINDSYELIYKNSNKNIFLAGISDSLYATKAIKDRTKTLFDYVNSESINDSVYKILLVHEPDDVAKIDSNKFNLILSGHSHNGQVRVPFIGSIWYPAGCKQYNKEYYNINGTDLYISNGLGTTLLPIRFLNQPSMNLFRIVKK